MEKALQEFSIPLQNAVDFKYDAEEIVEMIFEQLRTGRFEEFLGLSPGEFRYGKIIFPVHKLHQSFF